ncbi:9651_t:CDS:1, partial [Scutellospora calospora]
MDEIRGRVTIALIFNTTLRAQTRKKENERKWKGTIYKTRPTNQPWFDPARLSKKRKDADGETWPSPHACQGCPAIPLLEDLLPPTVTFDYHEARLQSQ